MASQNRLKQTVGFFTHHFDSETCQRYLRLKNSLQVPVYIVAEEGTPIPTRFHSETCFFNFSELSRGVSRVIGSKVTPGNCHLTMLAFSRRFPDFDYYWQVEYDVMYTGRWADFFSRWETNTADLLGCHIKNFEEEPTWYWWETLHLPQVTKEQYIRSFLPIYRISRSALGALQQGVAGGLGGHFEGLIPTLLGALGYSIQDFGQGELYTSSSCPDGDLFMGTMRFRPNHPFLLGKNLLYHPVKPGLRWKWPPEQLVWLGYFLRYPLGIIRDFATTLRLIIRSRRAEQNLNENPRSGSQVLR